MGKKKNDRTVGTTVTTMTRVVAYVRVSTEQQASEGASLEAQKRQLELYAELHGLKIVAYEIDAGLSASSLERPGLQSALACLESGSAEGLLVIKLDRLTRSVRDMAELVDRYFKTHRLMSVNESIDTGSASGRLVLNILVTVSQWEREAAAERTAAVMSHLKATGKFTGGYPPFGFSVDEDGGLVECLMEQSVLDEIRMLRGNKASIRYIASRVVNPRTGRTFSPTQIARMV